MKKLFLFLTIAVFALSAASCEGPRGPAGPGANAYIQPFEPPATDWQLFEAPGGEKYYYVEYDDFPQLTNLVLTKGTIVAYVREGNLQDMLPRVRHLTDGVTNWTSTIDYTIGLNSITFFYTNSNFLYNTGDEPEPGIQRFRVVLEW